MNGLARWSRSVFVHDGVAHDVHRRGEGPGVVVIHEIPGLTPEVVAFADEVVDAGYTVVLPDLFGVAEAPDSATNSLRTIGSVCVSKEFTMFARGRTTPVAGWLRALARALHHELGGPGVGALGMCFTGGFALAMMVDPSVAAPVVTQPASPVPITRGRGSDLALSPDDLAAVKQRVVDGCPVLGLRFARDWVTGSRFQALTRELGEGFIRVEFAGPGHSTLTRHRQQEGVDRVLAFFADRLRTP
ncbi:dienelactone hydrolase family protein [Luteipulveratus halotolerans]|uniref:Dienelactone hydrolase n=1 Tax=Luteipulveratus halotolerans TaxID=1631356 RepID=A0A0L6CLP3_9MICO|nr:dienelactone hydrolase family protein [Luteipulveratus halotolerans]KNX38555.1 dienelactone hydrolase [Luteipulveratus halotolerans]